MTIENAALAKKVNDWQERLFNARGEVSRQLKEASREMELARLGDVKCGDYVSAVRKRLIVSLKELDTLRTSIDVAMAERAAASIV